MIACLVLCFQLGCRHLLTTKEYELLSVWQWQFHKVILTFLLGVVVTDLSPDDFLIKEDEINLILKMVKQRLFLCLNVWITCDGDLAIIFFPNVSWCWFFCVELFCLWYVIVNENFTTLKELFFLIEAWVKFWLQILLSTHAADHCVWYSNCKSGKTLIRQMCYIHSALIRPYQKEMTWRNLLETFIVYSPLTVWFVNVLVGRKYYLEQRHHNELYH